MKIQQESIDILNKVEQRNSREWMNLKEGAEYVGVSYNTFIKFQLMGLKIVEIGRIKRVSRKEIDNFLNQYCY
ncbi:helix-turn-helix domain-containing protein [Planomicrobium sp. CPCC 101079]|uniref:helix-turn-helix domain-containing protein n=1 Tax=Planomicrobium sp. CPCC 101079 TaxID=2599618 RepID=UPI0011B46637|nr:helix-turn-helix domain-containing protein [Planomicrobium sp. CPCC 101079]TWT00114.1 helix-turn-helix domain-containing protein [Planomicrobium sp. CPCC 101079]